MPGSESPSSLLAFVPSHSPAETWVRLGQNRANPAGFGPTPYRAACFPRGSLSMSSVPRPRCHPVPAHPGKGWPGGCVPGGYEPGGLHTGGATCLLPVLQLGATVPYRHRAPVRCRHGGSSPPGAPRCLTQSNEALAALLHGAGPVPAGPPPLGGRHGRRDAGPCGVGRGGAAGNGCARRAPAVHGDGRRRGAARQAPVPVPVPVLVPVAMPGPSPAPPAPLRAAAAAPRGPAARAGSARPAPPRPARPAHWAEGRLADWLSRLPIEEGTGGAGPSPGTRLWGRGGSSACWGGRGQSGGAGPGGDVRELGDVTELGVTSESWE